MNACLIGYGYWGKIVHKYILDNKDINFIGICGHHYDNSLDLDEVIQAHKIDTAFVCLPIEKHYEVVKKLLINGINVFCEKPLCKSLAQTKELVSLAKEKDVVLFTDYIYTYSPSICFIKDNLCRFGDINSIYMEISQFGNFYKNDDVVEVLGVHLFSILSFWFENAKITVNSVIPMKKSEDGKIEAATLFLDINSNCNVIIKTSLLSNSKSRTIELLCKNGIIRFDMLSKNTVMFAKHKKTFDGWIEENHANYCFEESNNLKTVVSSFVDMVEGRKSCDKNLIITKEVADLMNKYYTITKGYKIEC